MTAPIRTIRIGFCAAITGGDRIVRGGGGPGAGNSTGLREREPARREGVTDILVVRADYGFRNNSGSLAIFAVDPSRFIRRQGVRRIGRPTSPPNCSMKAWAIVESEKHQR